MQGVVIQGVYASLRFYEIFAPYPNTGLFDKGSCSNDTCMDRIFF